MPRVRALSPTYVGRKVNADGIIVVAREGDLLATIAATGSTDIPANAALVLASNRDAWAILDGDVRPAETDVAVLPIKPIAPREEDVTPRVVKAADDARAALPEDLRDRIPAGSTIPADQAIAMGKRARDLRVPVESLVTALYRSAADSLNTEDDRDHHVTPEDRWLLDAMVAQQNGKPLPPKPEAKKLEAEKKDEPKPEPVKPSAKPKTAAKDAPVAPVVD